MSEKQWFAMRATYSQELKAQKELSDRGVESFVPMVYKVATRGGRKTKILAPAMNNYIFVCGTEEEISEVKAKIPYIRYVMDHSSQKVIVPSYQMENFMKVASLNDNSSIYYSPSEVNFKDSPRIRIHGGAFDGTEGNYVKIDGKRNKRLFVHLDNLVALTVIVDPELIEVID